MPAAVVGVELADSGTRLTASVRGADESLGAALAARRWHTRLETPPTAEEAVTHLHALIARALNESGAASGAANSGVAVGVAVGGLVDIARGVVRSVRLASGWEDYPLAAALAERWGGPVALLTATQAAALAEVRIGAGRGQGDLLYLLLGRGVSAALVLGGQIYAGAHGEAGDLAHWLALANGPRCACGARGHLEPIASAQSLVREMIGRAVDLPASDAAMLAISGGRAEAMTAEQVARLAAEGDPAAGAVVDRALDALAAALANLVAALDPAMIVLGGPLAGAREGFVAPLGRRVAALCQSFTTPPPVVGGELEPTAALIGALVRAEELARGI